MSKLETPASLVARFLRSNNYNETLDVFLAEANLPPETGIVSKGSLTLEGVLEEKKVFDAGRDFEKIGIHDENELWKVPSPSTSHAIQALGQSSNILHVSIESIDECGIINHLLLASSADRKLSLLHPEPPYAFSTISLSAFDSPILSCCILDDHYLLTSSMSGLVMLIDLRTGRTLSERTDHSKYVVKLTHLQDRSGIWLATAGWDAKVFLYRIALPPNDDGALELGSPVGTISLPTNPECILFVPHPELTTPVLVLGRRDSTFLYYYGMPTASQLQLPLLGQQNLAPHSNAWISFTPSAFALSPVDSSVLAVATSAVPHMKLIITRLLLPPPASTAGALASATARTYTTQASQARESLALQDREAAAVMVHCNTMAPQTPYSTPGLAWRPDGTGVWVNGDDGVIRGIESMTGKVVEHLKGGHEPGTKIRCLWAGWAQKPSDDVKEELLVSGGFDKKLIVWRCGMPAS